jgi:hypothetical protein
VAGRSGIWVVIWPDLRAKRGAVGLTRHRRAHRTGVACSISVLGVGWATLI